ncbi:MAG: hypothetical protein AABX38_04730 [Candidatus Micrarchaeota archaeon]
MFKLKREKIIGELKETVSLKRKRAFERTASIQAYKKYFEVINLSDPLPPKEPAFPSYFSLKIAVPLLIGGAIGTTYLFLSSGLGNAIIAGSIIGSFLAAYPFLHNEFTFKKYENNFKKYYEAKTKYEDDLKTLKFARNAAREQNPPKANA